MYCTQTRQRSQGEHRQTRVHRDNRQDRVHRENTQDKIKRENRQDKINRENRQDRVHRENRQDRDHRENTDKTGFTGITQTNKGSQGEQTRQNSQENRQDMVHREKDAVCRTLCIPPLHTYSILLSETNAPAYFATTPTLSLSRRSVSLSLCFPPLHPSLRVLLTGCFSLCLPVTSTFYSWHQPCNNQIPLSSTPLRCILKIRAIKGYSHPFRITCDLSAVSLLSSRE